MYGKFKLKKSYDIVIVGAGVIGLSVANALLNFDCKLSIAVLEKENAIGSHASGRNSGVIHAGFYYSPETLKARFCAEGNIALKRLCEINQIPIRNTGKIVVAQNYEESKVLQSLYNRGLTNGVELHFLEARELKRIEPLAVTQEAFIWSPTTSVSDPKRVLEVMSKQFLAMGGEVILNAKLEKTEPGRSLVSGNLIKHKHLVNCAGAQADRIAHTVNVGLDYAMIPFMGMYRAVEEKRLPIRTLIYPVPNPVHPFLGVHFTLTIDNKTKIGPTSLMVPGRENYSIFDKWTYRDFQESMTASLNFFRGDPLNVLRLLTSEIRKIRASTLIQEASKLVPSATTIENWAKKPAGIRAQLVHKPTQTLEQDYVVRSGEGSTHILNAVSPGWTSSIPFSSWVVEQYIRSSI
jgi:L-2-hydroxyglutarate oxidase